jgi:hypothetical protein
MRPRMWFWRFFLNFASQLLQMQLIDSPFPRFFLLPLLLCGHGELFSRISARSTMTRIVSHRDFSGWGSSWVSRMVAC